DSGFAFYFERELYFFLTRKTVFSKKTALSCIFFRISIDNLGPYMCYTNILYDMHGGNAMKKSSKLMSTLMTSILMLWGGGVFSVMF
ncbi:MAG: hypothetical protein IJS09_05845, partial [Treponema sp.]|nr:hypothetical protein [Treponema sp.]